MTRRDRSAQDRALAPARRTRMLVGDQPDHLEVRMPQLLQEGLPDRGTRSKFDFTAWADGQAWKFVKGEDYESSTETFRYNIRRWAKDNGFEAEVRPYPATDRAGDEVPLAKEDAVAVGVILRRLAAERRP
jgi:hypothetical protein